MCSEGMYIQNYQLRNYRQKFNTRRFRGFQVSYRETDLWVGVDTGSFQEEMGSIIQARVVELRHELDQYINTEPEFVKCLQPFQPHDAAPSEAKEMALAAARAGTGPMSAVAGLFSREAGKAISKNFSVKEFVIENGGDIFATLEDEFIYSVYAGKSPLSEKIGIAIPQRIREIGVCTSSGTVGPSLSFGKADAVAVACRDVLLADAFATALGNVVKSPADIPGALELSESFPEIISVVIVCEDRVGVRGEFEIKLLK